MFLCPTLGVYWFCDNDDGGDGKVMLLLMVTVMMMHIVRTMA